MIIFQFITLLFQIAPIGIETLIFINLFQVFIYGSVGAIYLYEEHKKNKTDRESTNLLIQNVQAVYKVLEYLATKGESKNE